MLSAAAIEAFVRDGFIRVEGAVPRSVATGRPVATATGNAGDVYLCHPFLVHAASWPHRGTAPRIMAQPGIALLAPFSLTDRAAAYPVETAILDAITN